MNAICFRSVLERHPEVNRSQVGVWGWGIPGYTALSTLTVSSSSSFLPSSDVKCAFAVAPPSDWKHFSEYFSGVKCIYESRYNF